MGRYIRRLTRIGSIGPVEERGFAIWVGYELPGVDDDLSGQGMLRVDDWPEDRIAAHGVSGFLRIDPGDAAMYDKLGIRRRP